MKVQKEIQSTGLVDWISFCTFIFSLFGYLRDVWCNLSFWYYHLIHSYMLKGLEAVNPRETPYANQFLIKTKAAFTGREKN